MSELGMYHGASTIMRKALDWNRSREQVTFSRMMQYNTVRPTRGYPRKMLVYKMNKSTIHLHVIPVIKCGCVFWEFAKRKLATRKDKIKIIKSLPLALSVSCEERCEVLACHQTFQQTSSGNS
jgi:hypothetical protein